MASDVRPVPETEWAGILKTFFRDGRLVQMPAKLRRKRIVMEHLVTLFSPGRTYTEQEVNIILGRVHPDFAALRRYLIDFGLLRRSQDGGEYWRDA